MIIGRYCDRPDGWQETIIENWNRPIVPLESGVLNLHGHIHNSIAPELGARHVNLCVEVRDYRLPYVTIIDII